MKKNVGALMAMAAMMSVSQDDLIEVLFDNPSRCNRKSEPKPKKGQKECFFNKFGHFETGSMLKSECVFKCFAINDKNAMKKFKKWQDKQPSK